jgi:hypothetical protein
LRTILTQEFETNTHCDLLLYLSSFESKSLAQEEREREKKMEARLSALFEERVGKVEQEMRVEMEKVREEMEKKMEKKTEEIESLRSNMARVESDNAQLNFTISQLKIDNARLTRDLSEIHEDLRILHPLPYARLHLQKCITHQIACNEAVNAFIDRYTLKVINVTPSLSLELQELKNELKKAWDARFAAAFLCDPRPTLENVLWIVAKSGFKREVAPLMNLSKATRECKDLQREMREVRMGMDVTQLHYYCQNGMTSSVVRMLEMRSIDVEAKEDVLGWTCLHTATHHGHLAICRLLIDKGAQLEAKNSDGKTPLHLAAYRGHVQIVRLLCDRGADVEARSNSGRRPLHFAAWNGHITVVKELIEERNAEINSRDDGGRTALRWARQYNKLDVAAYLVSHGGII